MDAIIDMAQAGPITFGEDAAGTDHEENPTRNDPSTSNEASDEASDTFEIKSVSFDDIFSELEDFQMKNKGSLTIPTSHPALARIIDSLTSSCIELLAEKRWNDQLASLEEYKEEHGNSEVPLNHPTLGEWAARQRDYFKLREQGRPNPLTDQRVQYMKEKASFHFTLWDKRYDDLKEFKKEYGHCDVPIDYPRLGIWVFNQRYTLSEMLQYRIDLLDSVGFIWNHNEELPPKMMETWNYVFDRYKQFIIDHDGVDFLYRDALLFDWAKRQRCEYRKYMSKDCTTKFMNRTLIEKLDEVGFDWNLDDDESVSWDAHYEQLKQYKEEHGHARVKRDNSDFGIWYDRQSVELRRYQSKRTGGYSITEDRVEKLLALGIFEQKETNQENTRNAGTHKTTGKYKTIPWDERFEALKKFGEENGHFKIPNNHPTFGFLGYWPSSQRSEYNRFRRNEPSKLDQYRVDKLNSIGFLENVREHNRLTWDEHYKNLLQFKKDNGHLKVPHNDPTCGNWASEQRTQYYKYFRKGKESKLNQTKVDTLLSIGFLEDRDRSEKPKEDEALVRKRREHQLMRQRLLNKIMEKYLAEKEIHGEKLPDGTLLLIIENTKEDFGMEDEYVSKDTILGRVNRNSLFVMNHFTRHKYWDLHDPLVEAINNCLSQGTSVTRDQGLDLANELLKEHHPDTEKDDIVLDYRWWLLFLDKNRTRLLSPTTED